MSLVRKWAFTDQFLSFISGPWFTSIFKTCQGLSIEHSLSLVSNLGSRLLVSFSALAGLPQGEMLLAFFFVYAAQATSGASTSLLQLCPLLGEAFGGLGPQLIPFDPC